MISLPDSDRETRLRERIDELREERDAALHALHEMRRQRDRHKTMLNLTRKRVVLWRTRYEHAKEEIRELRKDVAAFRRAHPE